MCRIDNGACSDRSAKGAAVIGARVQHRIAHRIHYPARDLGAGGRVEIAARHAGIGQGKRRKGGADGGDIEAGDHPPTLAVFPVKKRPAFQLTRIAVVPPA